MAPDEQQFYAAHRVCDALAETGTKYKTNKQGMVGKIASQDPNKASTSSNIYYFYY